MPRAQDLIATAYQRFIGEVPGLGNLKLTMRVELRGRGDVQVFSVRMPGPIVTKGEPENARLELAMPRADFNQLAERGKLDDWREAYEHGHIKVSGEREIQQLLGKVIERHTARTRLKRAR
jgi:hypothetical protein